MFKLILYAATVKDLNCQHHVISQFGLCSPITHIYTGNHKLQQRGIANTKQRYVLRTLLLYINFLFSILHSFQTLNSPISKLSTISGSSRFRGLALTLRSPSL